ncbi:TPA: tetratricopeptide repeat protein [Candidatus Scatousia excrementigallinarum]|uniref:Tetratricopeptide repeat protein n=1 Tax=Candidatus Scatousia excrementigallinarum TaxID=2840935 RepID=A0A9D1F126_9BACT|nr:tetratricopeptide repeat protein [Candidatus Scatousia excrementigallinarum]
MSEAFIDGIVDKKILLKNENNIIDPFLLENNLSQIENIHLFLTSQKTMLLVNGFLGTGKTAVVNYALSFVSSSTAVLNYNCYETTILDDILLSFFEDFKQLALKNIIKQPKAKFDNFTQKIDAYFSCMVTPVVIVLNSFEMVLKDNKREILDFLFHLSRKNNIKIIIISRKFDYDEFKSSDYDRVSILALDKSVFEKLLRSEGVRLIGPVSDELYRYSRGYFFYTKLSLNVIKAHNLNLVDFLKGYTKSFLSYNDFILREALSFVDPVSGHLFRFLTTMRHPVSVNLLKTLNLYNEERIKYFTDNMILSQDKNMIYLQDYYKEISANSIPESVSVKLHRACVDLYNTQLPLKPFERDLLISRQTMRAEIDYHSMFIPQKPAINPVNSVAINSIEYSAEGLSAASEKKEVQNSGEKLKNISFIFETEEDEKKIMSEIADSINKFIDYSNKTLNESETKLSLAGLINSAKKEENEYNFKKAIAFYQRALLKKDDDDFYTFLPTVYTRLAMSYEKLSDWFNALRYYDLALEFFTSAGDTDRCVEMKLAVANIFYITFKHDKAKILIEDILKEKNISAELLIKADMLAATLYNEDLLKSYSYYKNAVESSRSVIDKTLLAELYFKYALCCDELDETEEAVLYYRKCCEIEKNNPHLASALSNLALIFDETGMNELAFKYYVKSLEIDEQNENNNGIYSSAIKLAEMTSRKYPEKAEVYYQKAVKSANLLNENIYKLTVYIEYGDFFMNHKNIKMALNYYLLALNLTDDNKELEQKVHVRLNDLKIRLGSRFEEIKQDIENEK